MQANPADSRGGWTVNRAHRLSGTGRSVIGMGAALLSLALVAAGCGSSSPTPTASHSTSPASSPTSTSSGSAHVVTITYWNMWSGVYEKLIQGEVNDFNAAHPDIHVKMLSVPSANGDAKLLSSIAAGDPPDVFTEWNPEIASYAATGAIQQLNQFMTGKYAAMSSWLYPQAAAWGSYGGKIYGIPMELNANALYYNKTMLKAIGASGPPKTWSQLMADSAKEWKVSGSRVEQMGFYPTEKGFDTFQCNFKVTTYKNGKYVLASNPGALAEMRMFADFSKYPYGAVTAFSQAFGSAGGGSENPFVMGKEGFRDTGPWDGVSDIPVANPTLSFGVEPLPAPPGGTSDCTNINGNYNIIPKGASHPKAAFTFAAWMAGYHNAAWAAQHLPSFGGTLPVSAQVADQSVYKSWLAKHPFMNTFVAEMKSPADTSAASTPAEAQYENAIGTAVQAVATNKESPQQALDAVQSAANQALKSAG